MFQICAFPPLGVEDSSFDALVGSNSVPLRPGRIAPSGQRSGTGIVCGLLALFICSLLPILSGCGFQANGSSDNSLVISPDTIDFGDVPVGQTANASVSITNQGALPVSISQVTVAGQTFFLNPQTKLPTTIAPGATYSFELEFAPNSTTSYSGTLTAMDSGAHPVAQCHIRGWGTSASHAELSVTPTSLDYGDITVGSSATKSITLTSIGSSTTTISSVTVSGAGFSVSGASFPIKLPPQHSVTLQVKFAPEAAGSGSGALTILSNSNNSSTTVSLHGSGEAAVLPQLSVHPQSLSFGSITVGSSSTQPVTLTSTGNAPVTIDSAALSGTGFTVSGVTFPLTLNPQQSATLYARFEPSKAGAATGKLVVKSDSIQNSVITINLAGTGKTAVLSANPTSLKFSNVTIGSATTQPITLTATGTAPITITGATAAGTGFSLYKARFPITLQPSQIVELYVVFRPTTADKASGTLTVDSNAGSPLLIPMSGTGTSDENPQLTVTPTDLDFRNVDVNSTATQTVTVISTGTSAATLSAATLRGTGFSLSGPKLPLTLQPRSRATFTIQFAPSTSDSYTGSLAITSNSSTNKTVNVSLSGTGVEESTPQLRVNPTDLSFGNVTVGSSSTQPITLSSTGTEPVVINSIALDGSGFSISKETFPLQLNPKQTVTLQVRFTPTDTGMTTGTVTIQSNSTTNATSTVSLAGTGKTAPSPQLSVSAAAMSFGDVMVGSSSTQPLTLTSTGTAAVTISTAEITGAGFTISDAEFPLTLNPKQSITLQVRFAPTTAKAISGQLTVSSNSSTNPTAIISLTGTGTPAPSPQLSISAASMSFGDVTVGSSSTQPLTLTSTGTTAVTINAATITGTGFTVSGSDFPLTLNPNQSATLQVRFSPAATGSVTGRLVIDSNSLTNSTATIPLNGTGASAPSPQLSISTASLGFGNVTVGSSSTQPLTLTSTGTAAVTIDAATVTGAGFTVSGVTLPVTLNPQQSVTLQVEFSPSSAGAAAGQLTIKSNSATNATTTLSLRGTGESAPSPHLSLSAASLAFGNVTVGSSSTLSLAITSTGTAPLTINSASITGTGFTVSGTSFPLTLNPQQSVTLKVQFAPRTAGVASGRLTIKSNSATNATIAVNLSGTGIASLIPQLSINVSSLSFGNVTVGHSSTQSLTLSSNGTGSLIISSASLTGANFTISGVSFPLTLNSQQSAPLDVTFAPQTTGAASGTLVLVSDSVANGITVVTLNGTGVATVAQLSLSAASLNFGNINVGSSSSAALTLTASGTAAVTISSVTISGAGFTLSGASFPLTLNPNQSVTLDVTFAPSAAGAVTGALVVNSNAVSNATQTATLSGTGTSNEQHVVEVTWNAPTSSPVPVVGYNVYRATGTSTAYTLLNSSISLLTVYDDNTVQSGITYSYEVKSVDASGMESAPSNISTISVP